MPLNQMQAEKLAQHEGLRLRKYKDTKGVLTIGIGYNLEANMLNLPESEIKSMMTIGITEEKAYSLLKQCCNKVEAELQRNIKFYSKLDSNTRYVLIELAFNLGIAGLLKFKKTLALIEKGDYKGASKELLNSKWAHDVDKDLTDNKGRANDLANVLATGKLR